MNRKYKLLIISSLILFSLYYAYDLPAAINNKFVFDDRKFTAFTLTMLYSAYAFPNILAPLIYINLKIRDKVSLKILTFIVFTGQFVFTAGVYFKKFYLMVLGRFLFGIGCESYTVIQNKIVGNTFREGELSTAMSFLVAMGRLGTITNFILTPRISEIKVFYSCLVALGFTFCGFILSFFVKQKRKLNLRIINEEKIGIDINDDVNDEIDEPEKYKNPLFILPDQTSPWVNNGDDKNPSENFNDENSLFRNKNDENPFNNLKSPLDDLNASFKNEFFYQKDKNLKIDENSSLQKIRGEFKLQNDDFSEKQFAAEAISNKNSDYQEIFTTANIVRESHLPILYKKENDIHPTFIILTAIGFLFACVWSPFYNIGSLVFQKKYNLSNKESGHVMSLLEIISIFVVIISGALVDYLGSRILFIASGGFLLLFSHIFILININYILIAIFLGISGPLVATYWPCTVYLSTPDSLGKSLAIMYSVINFSITFSPLIISYLANIDENYNHVEFYLILVTFLAIFCVFLLNFYNKKYNLGLNKKAGIFMNSPEMV
ncbi:Major facilitator superfamily domain-containing protein 1 [Dictyocoela muelleri]|nr:Major facilitator superfamily domain-containing protein 1 [Dictyocoela muelleri]